MDNELEGIIKKFAESGWDVIDEPSRVWLDNDTQENKARLIKAIESADEFCGSCGCEYDALYKRALELLGA